MCERGGGEEVDNNERRGGEREMFCVESGEYQCHIQNASPLQSAPIPQPHSPIKSTGYDLILIVPKACDCSRMTVQASDVLP